MQCTVLPQWLVMEPYGNAAITGGGCRSILPEWLTGTSTAAASLQTSASWDFTAFPLLLEYHLSDLTDSRTCPILPRSVEAGCHRNSISWSNKITHGVGICFFWKTLIAVISRGFVASIGGLRWGHYRTAVCRFVDTLAKGVEELRGGKAVTGNSREGADGEDGRQSGEVGGGKWEEGFSSPPKQRLLAL